MPIEYEATFADIDKERVRQSLKRAGAKLVKPEFLQKRTVFFLPEGYDTPEAWARVRDEGDRITMSYKYVAGGTIEGQREVEVVVNDFQKAVELLEAVGCRQKAYQESKRERWLLDGVEVVIDEWPFLEPLVEIEGENEQAVKKVARKLGFDYSQAIFDSVDFLYQREYGVSRDIINNKTPRIVFNEENPFLKKS